MFCSTLALALARPICFYPKEFRCYLSVHFFNMRVSLCVFLYRISYVCMYLHSYYVSFHTLTEQSKCKAMLNRPIPKSLFDRLQGFVARKAFSVATAEIRRRSPWIRVAHFGWWQYSYVVVMWSDRMRSSVIWATWVLNERKEEFFFIPPRQRMTRQSIHRILSLLDFWFLLF